METIKTGIKNIVENSVGSSRRFESVQDELMDYQFQYVEKIEKGNLNELMEVDDGYEEDVNDDGYKKWRKKLEDRLENTFEKKLFKYTNLHNDLWDEYKKRINKKDIKSEQFDEWFKNILDIINDDYILRGKEWKDNVKNIIKENLDRIGPITKEYLKEKKRREKEEKKKTVGLINFNLKEVNKLEKFGIDPNSQCLEIHFKDLFEQKEKNNAVNIFSGESLSNLAKTIIDKFPYIKAVLGYSWMVDSPIGGRVGFTVYHKDNKMGGAFWGQFINEKGEINKERMQKFLNTGIPEFFPARGFIKVEDFLKKYLPKEKKGIIELADLSEESLKFIEVLKKLEGDNFASVSFEEIKSIINENNILSEYIKTQDGINILNMIKIVKDTNAKSLDDIEYPNKEILRKRFGDFIEENKSKYTNKEVLIN